MTKKGISGTGKKAQWVEVLATKLSNLSSILGTHKIG